ncbi:MAG: molybdopterin synthase sulfur carrier subunit [Candidatus Azotimanducaceae bacterium]|jgi:molybdopterin synthase sulfur carrier subunit
MINILFFASLKEQLLVAGVEFAISEKLTVSQLIISLCQRENSDWEDILRAEDILVAVNQTVVDRGFLVSAGDEVAFFPPVTGG